MAGAVRKAAQPERIASGEDGFGDFCQDKSHPRDSAEALFWIFIVESRQ